MSEHSEDDIDDIEHILENIRHNCVVMSERHKSRFLYLKGILRYFRIPIIILSGINSVIAVGLQPYIEQGLISVFTCLVSLVCGIIGSIELYLSIQTQMENELVTSKEYYLLGIEIYKLLSLKIGNRNIDIKSFMEEKFSQYQKLIEKSNVIIKKITDKLTQKPGIRDLENKYSSTDFSEENTPVKSMFSTTRFPQLYSHVSLKDEPPSEMKLNINEIVNDGSSSFEETLNFKTQRTSHPINVETNSEIEIKKLQKKNELLKKELDVFNPDFFEEIENLKTENIKLREKNNSVENNSVENNSGENNSGENNV